VPQCADPYVSEPATRQMIDSMKVTDIELSEPVAPLAGIDGYAAARLLVRYHGTPLGWVTVPLVGGGCGVEAIATEIRRELCAPLLLELIYRRLGTPLSRDLPRIDELLGAPRDGPRAPSPPITVAVCTRNRPGELALCLDSLAALDERPLEILIVDNAPSDDTTERLVRERFPDARYVQEPRPGLDWARNRAIEEARGEIIAFTDDDVTVDRGWTRAIGQLFAGAPDLAAMTGLVVPFALDTEAQRDFEAYGGFGRGFERRWHRAGDHHGTGRFGTGANMAFRRSLFDEIGRFDPALDVGTPTDGGGDLEMFFRLMQEGHTLVYEPRAMVRHRHRPEAARLRKQIRDWGTGVFSYMRRSVLAYPDERAAFRRLKGWWIRRYIIRRYVGTFAYHAEYPRALILEEVRGALRARAAYRESRRRAMALEREAGTLHPRSTRANAPRDAIAVRTAELTAPLVGVADTAGFRATRMYLTLEGSPIARAEIENGGESISALQLRDAISEELAQMASRDHQHEIIAGLDRWLRRGVSERSRTPARALVRDNVSVVVATYDRPNDLRACLRCLAAQVTDRAVEIIVVDNHPQSALAAPVVAEFPGVRLIVEERQGLSYARNAGIVASRGTIIVATDDDVEMPSDWLERLVADFANPDVMIVTGNALPMELETLAQRKFEQYGGLGRGFSRLEAGPHWFASFERQAVPTWTLGATANAAFRASIFSHSDIGLLDPALGAGSPTGCSEDTDLFYRVLAAGFTIVYEPDAFVWHHHRRDMRALRRQLYNYSKGHVAYHLITWQRNRDARALYHLAVTLPLWHAKAIAKWMLRRRDYPLALTFIEIAGNLAGPWALWRSRRRVKRLGSGPAVEHTTSDHPPGPASLRDRPSGAGIPR
jgi:O-antigen biosynthesis protein